MMSDQTKNRIDWDQVHSQLRETRAALERILQVDPDELRKVFRVRADRLARRSERKTQQKPPIAILVFRLGSEEYAVELTQASQVIPLCGQSPVPGGRPELVGVVNVRGEIQSILDPKRMLELPVEPDETEAYVVFVRHAAQSVGLRVDSVERVEHIRLEELTLLTNSSGSPQLRFSRGLSPQRVNLLNVDALFNHFRSGVSQG